jgi:hypothetical protein
MAPSFIRKYSTFRQAISAVTSMLHAGGSTCPYAGRRAFSSVGEVSGQGPRGSCSTMQGSGTGIPPRRLTLPDTGASSPRNLPTILQMRHRIGQPGDISSGTRERYLHTARRCAAVSG